MKQLKKKNILLVIQKKVNSQINLTKRKKLLSQDRRK